MLPVTFELEQQTAVPCSRKLFAQEGQHGQIGITLMARQIVMDHTGDTRHPSNPEDAQELVNAERRFNELTQAGFTAAAWTAPEKLSKFGR
jgi:uncharacterized protein YoaH (UPF0181 family)